jgi:phage protein U
MYAQLGTILFDGRKSFVSFGDEKEAILVEHARINNDPKLQRAGSGSRKVSLSIYLHQEFCVVEDEKTKLNEYLDGSEILPLLWGNGKIEGEFVIQSISRTVNDQDSFGNILGCTVSLSLIEVKVDDRLEKQQQKAKGDAFAVGNKKPAITSSKVNPATINKNVALNVQAISTNGKSVDDKARKYAGAALDKKELLGYIDKIFSYANYLDTISGLLTEYSGIVDDFKTAAGNVAARCTALSIVLGTGSSNISAQAGDLAVAIRSLKGTATTIVQNSITRK